MASFAHAFAIICNDLGIQSIHSSVYVNVSLFGLMSLYEPCFTIM